MVNYIDAYRNEFGVEPICEVLQFAPSTYYATKSRPMSQRGISDVVMKVAIFTVWQANYEVYGVRKMWKAMRRAGADVGRDQVARLMGDLGIAGARRGKRVKTTCSDPKAARPPDLVNRDFTATGPNQLWVTDVAYVPTWSGMVYVSNIGEVFARTIVGWRVASHMRTVTSGGPCGSGRRIVVSSPGAAPASSWMPTMCGSTRTASNVVE